MKGDGRNILYADEWDFAVAAGCVDLALALDGGKRYSFGEVFYAPVIHSRPVLQNVAETDP